MDKASLDIQSLYSRPLIGRPDAESAEVMEAIADRLSMYPVTDDRTMIAAALYGYAKDLKGSIEHLEARVKELEEKAPSMVLHGIQKGKQLAQSGGALMWDNEMVSPADYARKLVQANITSEAE